MLGFLIKIMVMSIIMSVAYTILSYSTDLDYDKVDGKILCEYRL